MEFEIRNEDKKNKNKIENIKNEYSIYIWKII